MITFDDVKAVPQLLEVGQEVDLSLWTGDSGQFTQKPKRANVWTQAKAESILRSVFDMAGILFVYWLINSLWGDSDESSIAKIFFAIGGLLVLVGIANSLATALVHRPRFFDKLARTLLVEAAPEGQLVIETYGFIWNKPRRIVFLKRDVKFFIGSHRLKFKGFGPYERRVLDMVCGEKLVAHVAPDLLVLAARR